MIFAVILLVALPLAAAVGFSIGFMIFSVMLNSSNNFGDSKSIIVRSVVSKEVLRSKENLSVLYGADKIKSRDHVFEEHINIGMREIVSNPTYHTMMSRSIKSPDYERVAHQKDVIQ